MKRSTIAVMGVAALLHERLSGYGGHPKDQHSRRRDRHERSEQRPLKVYIGTSDILRINRHPLVYRDPSPTRPDSRCQTPNDESHNP
jgi:hypothetical protein